MAEVAKQSTPLGMVAIRDTLRQYWLTATDLEVAYFAALSGIETGHGKDIKNWNFGAFFAGGYSQGVEHISYPDYWRPAWFADDAHPLRAKMLAGEVPSAFRAYPSLEEGFADFIRVIRLDRYAPLRAAANRDDPAGFVSQLSDTGYSKDYGPEHVPGFVSMLKSLGHQPPGSKSTSPVAVVSVVTFLAASAGYLVYRARRKRR